MFGFMRILGLGWRGEGDEGDRGDPCEGDRGDDDGEDEEPYVNFLRVEKNPVERGGGGGGGGVFVVVVIGLETVAT